MSAAPPVVAPAPSQNATNGAMYSGATAAKTSRSREDIASDAALPRRLPTTLRRARLTITPDIDAAVARLDIISGSDEANGSRRIVWRGSVRRGQPISIDLDMPRAAATLEVRIIDDSSHLVPTPPKVLWQRRIAIPNAPSR